MADEDDPRIIKATMGWKTFIVRLIEALRWPAAFIAAIYILREGLGNVLDRLGHFHL